MAKGLSVLGVVALAYFSPATPAGAQSASPLQGLNEIALGRLDISDLPTGAVRFLSSSIQDDVVWDAIEISTKKAKLRLYSDSTRSRLLFSGDIENLKLRAELAFVPYASHTQIKIAAQQLQLTLGHVTGTLPTTIGDELQVEGRKLWIVNDKTVSISQNTFDGEITLHVWEPTWVGPKLLLSGAPSGASIQFKSLESNGDVDALVSLSDGSTKIIQGSFPFRKETASGSVVVAGENVSAGTFQADAGSIDFTAGTGSATFRSVVLDGVTSLPDSGFGIGAHADGPMKATAIKFLVQDFNKELLATDSVVSGLDANLSTITVAAPPIQAAQGQVHFDEISAATISGKLSLTSVDLSRAIPFQNSVVSLLVLNFSGSRSTPDISGTGTISSIGIGALRIANLTKGTLDFSLLSKDTYAITLNGTGPGTIALGSGAAGALAGNLVSFSLLGTYVSSGTPRLTIDPKNLSFSVSGASANVTILGKALQFPSDSISLQNDTAISIQPGVSGGTLTSNIPAVQLGNIFVAADDGTNAAPLSVVVAGSESFSIGWDIATGLPSLAGSITLPGFTITVPDPPKFLWIRTKNFDFQFNSLQVGSLALNFEGSMVQVSIANIVVQGNQITGRFPDYSGNLATPLTISSASGTEAIDLPLTLDNLEISNSSVAVSNGIFEGQGVNVFNAALAVELAHGSESSSVGSVKASTGMVNISGDSGGGTATVASLQFSFTRAKDTLNGNGSVAIGPFSFHGSGDNKLWVAQCSSNQLHYSVAGASVGISGPLTVTNNRVVADLDLQPALSSAETSYYRCDYLQHVTVIRQQKLHYKYPCFTWRQPFRFCDGWTYITPSVAFNVQMVLEIQPIKGFAATAEAYTQLDGSHLTVCWVRPIVALTSPIIIVWGVNAPGLPGDVLRIIQGIIESTLATSLVATSEALVSVFLGIKIPISHCN
jgi:hypothetical protein